MTKNTSFSIKNHIKEQTFLQPAQTPNRKWGTKLLNE